MKILIGLVLAFVIGAACRYFDIPVPSPPVLPGALLVVATTLGYTTVDRALVRRHDAAAQKPRIEKTLVVKEPVGSRSGR